ncbi:MAG: Hpt domain-containing protein [Bdellovibrionota bacterium]
MTQNKAQKEATLNVSVLDDLRKLDRSPRDSVVTELLEAFLSEVPEMMRNMRSALEAQNIFSIRKQAHALKSNAGNLGADRFAAICQNIEKGPEALLKNLIEELEAEYRLVAEQMHQQMKKTA